MDIIKKFMTLHLSGNISKSYRNSYRDTRSANYGNSGELIDSTSHHSRTHVDAQPRLNGGARLAGTLSNTDYYMLIYTYSDSRSNSTLDIFGTDALSGTQLSGSRTLSSTESTMHAFTGSYRFGKPKLWGGRINTIFSYYNRHYTNSSDYYLYDPESGESLRVEERFNGLQYTQQVISGRISYSKTLKRLGIGLYLILENERDRGIFLSTGGTRLDYNEFNVLPAVSFSYRKFQLSYTSGIRRPDISMLNPYIDDSDPANLRTGNPGLRGEFTHSIESKYGFYLNKRKKHGLVTLRYIAKYIDNAISAVTTVDRENISLTTYSNLGLSLQQSLMVNFSASALADRMTFSIWGDYSIHITDLQTEAITGWKV